MPSPYIGLAQARGGMTSTPAPSTTPSTPSTGSVDPYASRATTSPLATPPGSTYTPSYDTSVANSGYNPFQYATQTSANQLANMYGGSVSQTSGLGGPNAPPPQFQVNTPGMQDPSNAGILGQMTQQFGQPMTQSILNAEGSYNGLKQAQDSVAASNSPQALQFWQNLAPSLNFQPNGGISYPGMPGGMTLASAAGTLTPQGWSNAPQQPQSNFQQPTPQPQQQQQQMDFNSLNSLMQLMSLFGGGGMGMGMMGMGGMGMNPYSGLYSPWSMGNQLSGIASLLNSVQGLQQSVMPQPAMLPNVNLYYPMLGAPNSMFY